MAKYCDFSRIQKLVGTCYSNNHWSSPSQVAESENPHKYTNVSPSITHTKDCVDLVVSTADMLAWSDDYWGWFNIKMLSYQYRKSHCGDKTVVRSSYLHNGISYTGKTTSLYWIRAFCMLILTILRITEILFIWQETYCSFKYGIHIWQV